MANLLVLGTQWGDEGKGKIVDLLTPAFDVVARYQGGHNAGHTVYVKGRKVVLHLIPSGILHAGTLCVIGNGLVIAPAAFFREIGDLEAQGVAAGPARVAVSRAAHLIMPWHPLAERFSEDRRGEKKIGTTGRGIGPAYEDKVARRAVRLADLMQRDRLAARLGEILDFHNFVLSRYFSAETVDFQRTQDELVAQAERIEPLLADVSVLLRNEMKR
ncbi:MAG: adenylosuccinate synthase, partial [Candidatus Aminicenantes bacterium]|nr:adenylosuccinate synthase [Candidatus Aminicenantes bacterium]